MNELTLDIKKSIGKYEPIETEGLTLYPITVENYYEFLTAKPSLDFMQQTLPIELMSIPLLDAYFRIDMGLVDGIQPTGLFTQALLALALALRLMPHGKPEEQVRKFPIVPDDVNNPTRLKHLRFVRNGEEICTITPVQFGRLRPIIAAQNGVELVSDTANPELIQAEMDIQQMNQAFELDVNIDDMKATVAMNQRMRMKDLDDWTILEFDLMKQAIDREKHFMVYGIGEASGMVKFKNGNPVPSLFFTVLFKMRLLSLSSVPTITGTLCAPSLISKIRLRLISSFSLEYSWS